MKRFLPLVFLLFSIDASARPEIVNYGVTIHKPDKAYPGLTLFADWGAPNRDAEAKVFLLDMRGKLINQWSNQELLFLAKPQDDGSIATWQRKVGGGAQKLSILNWSGAVTWQYYNFDLFEQHHDFEILPDGNVLILGRKSTSNQAIAPYEFHDDIIAVIDRATKEPRWIWRTSDHYHELGLSDQAKEIIYNGESPYPDKEDIFHTNSIQYLPENPHSDPRFRSGNILVSQRNTNMLFIIDQDTGKIVWRMSGNVGQHHARMIPDGLPGAGNILIFNNGGEAGYPKKTQLMSTIKEINPATRQVEWLYKSPYVYGFFSPWRGSAQRLPNGNTLICESQHGRIFEVTTGGEVVWEYVHRFATDDPAVRVIYRAYRVNQSWPAVQPDSGYRNWTW